MNPLRFTQRLRDFWPFLWWAALITAMIFIFLLLRSASFITLIGFGVIAILIYRSRWLIPFAKKVWCFQRVAAPGIRLLYDPELQNLGISSSILQTCQTELQRLGEHFGFSLPGELRIFLFAHWKEIGRIFGQPAGAISLVRFNTILIGSDHPYMRETLRHELTHLFPGRWDWLVPPLLREGLATWLQGSYWGQQIDAAALPYLKDDEPRITSLLSRKFFYSDPHRQSSYVLAASFTGFLIRTYGWERYQKLYRRATAIDFKVQFKKCIGTKLEVAESQWRHEALVHIERCHIERCQA